MDKENETISVLNDSNLSDIDANMYAVNEAFMVLRSAISKRHYGEVVDIKGATNGLLNGITELLNVLGEERINTEGTQAENNS